MLTLNSACNLPFVFLFRLMACLAPPVPSALASFLSTLLPCGFAVGPSQLYEGRLGLWWVGRSLEAGSLVGRDGDTEWASKYHTDPMTHSQDGELTMNPESKTGQTNSREAEKVTNQEQLHRYVACRQSQAVISIQVDCPCRFCRHILSSNFCSFRL